MEQSMECPALAETALTGYLGAAIIETRGITYRIEFRNGVNTATRDNRPVGIHSLPRNVVTRAVKIRDVLLAGLTMHANATKESA